MKIMGKHIGQSKKAVKREKTAFKGHTHLTYILFLNVFVSHTIYYIFLIYNNNRIYT